jgi:hypothetical protein
VPCEPKPKGGKAKGAVAELVGGATRDPAELLRQAAGKLAQRGTRTGIDWLRVKAREQLGEKWVPLTKREKRERTRQRKALERELRAKRKEAARLNRKAAAIRKRSERDRKRWLKQERKRKRRK